jgi:hypothetical protein
MGCDIHIVLERRMPGKEWIGLYATDYHPGPRIKVAQRDYEFFAEIANVRGLSKSSRYPKNVPEDISDLAWAEYIRCPTDHHSASHASLSDFCEVYLSVNPSAGRKEFAASDLFGIDSDWPENAEYRVVFWFDN